MLKKKHKISREVFNEVFKKGVSTRSDHFIFKHTPQINTDYFSTSFVISKKVAKNAVTRQKNKRRGYYILKKLENKIHKPFLGIFIIRKPIHITPFNDIEEEIHTLLKGLLKS